MVGPRPLRSLARLGLGGYAAALGWAGSTALREEPGGDALLVPVVLATMHVAHGTGTLRWFARHPPPPHVLAQFARAPAPPDGPPGDGVFNPSLER
jgi:hypothetical protein